MEIAVEPRVLHSTWKAQSPSLCRWGNGGTENLRPKFSKVATDFQVPQFWRPSTLGASKMRDNQHQLPLWKLWVSGTCSRPDSKSMAELGIEARSSDFPLPWPVAFSACPIISGDWWGHGIIFLWEVSWMLNFHLDCQLTWAESTFLKEFRDRVMKYVWQGLAEWSWHDFFSLRMSWGFCNVLALDKTLI